MAGQLVSTAGGSSPHGPLHRAAWVSSQHGGWLFPAQGIPREQGRSYDALCSLALEITHCHCCNIPFVKQVNPIQCRRRLHTNVNTRRRASLGTTLESGYQPEQYLACHKNNNQLPLMEALLLPNTVPCSLHTYSRNNIKALYWFSVFRLSL